MLEIRKSAERGAASYDWLQSRHTFSFGDYFDRKQVGFGPLRVINEDRVKPSKGFGTHGHRDMEIISYVLDGELAHKDSMGNGSVLKYGDVQRMSAGTGVRHSEFNHSAENPVHFLQIWIEPNLKSIEPSYEEKHFDVASKQGKLRLIVSPDGRDGSVSVQQDALMYASILNNEDRIEYSLEPGRIAYIHVVRGHLDVNGLALTPGDGLKVSGETSLTLSKATDAEVILFDLPS